MRTVGRWLFAAIAGVVLASCGGHNEPPTPSIDVPTPTLESVTPSKTAQSPTLTRLAFVDKDRHIWTVDAAGLNKEKLFDVTPTKVSEFGTPEDFVGQLRWSPDGSKLAFNWNSELYIINAEGKEILRMAAGFVAWSPPGDRFIVSAVVKESSHSCPSFSPTTTCEQFSAAQRVMDLARQVVIELPRTASNVSLSSDGDRVAFFDYVPGAYSDDGTLLVGRGMVAVVETGELLPLDDGDPRAVRGNIVFSPSDPSLLAYGDRLINLGTREERHLPAPVASWSPD